MNVASLENCKTLFELSGWEDADDWYRFDNPMGKYVIDIELLGSICPAYDLGFLMRKLPARIEHEYPNDLEISKENDEKYWASYCHVDDDIISAYGDTPEDAACKLAIELFQRGILTREGEKER